MSPTAPFTLGLDVEADADAVWELLISVSQWPRWGPTVREAQLDDGAPRLRPGSTGRVRTPVCVWVPFAVEAWRDGGPERHWSWRVAGIPATGHTVTRLAPGRCRVEMTAPLWAVGYSPVLLVGLRRIRALAEAPRAGAGTTG